MLISSGESRKIGWSTRTGSQGTSRRSDRKWIRRRIEQLDPYADYVEIWALSYIYNTSDFELHWAYTLSNSHLGLTLWGADAAYREGTGAMIVQAESRTANTNDHLLLWSEHGPESPVTQQAIDIVNKYHVKWAKSYPGAFSHTEDYVYLFSDAATADDSLRRSLGLPGWSEKQKIAAHRFWCGIADLFTIESGETLTDVEPMPKDFDAMAEYAKAYTERPWPNNPIGAPFTEELLKQFTDRWFRSSLARPFGRALVTTFFAPSLFRIYGMKPASWPLRVLARNAMRGMILYSDLVRADEKEPITERRRRAAILGGEQASRVDSIAHRAAENRGDGGTCPHLRVD
ncbi:hypothetical protein JCM18899A_50790 [Nocardioides sp. AN3]